MDLSGIEPLSKIHTLYNCLRCFKIINIKEIQKWQLFFTSTITTDILLFFGTVFRPPFYIQSCCLFLVCGDYVTNRAQLYISKPCRNHYKPLITIKWVVSTSRIWDGCQTPLFLLTLLPYVLTMVRGGGTPCVPSLPALFSSRLLHQNNFDSVLVYWLLVEDRGYAPLIELCKSSVFLIIPIPHARPSPRI